MWSIVAYGGIMGLLWMTCIQTTSQKVRWMLISINTLCRKTSIDPHGHASFFHILQRGAAIFILLSSSPVSTTCCLDNPMYIQTSFGGRNFHFITTHWTCFVGLEPFIDTFSMEVVRTWKTSQLLTISVLADADDTFDVRLFGRVRWKAERRDPLDLCFVKTTWFPWTESVGKVEKSFVIFLVQMMETWRCDSRKKSQEMMTMFGRSER